MIKLEYFILLLSLHIIVAYADDEVVPEHIPRVVCFYDTISSLREGPAKLTNALLQIPLINCTHLVYGYVGIRGDNYEVKILNEDFDIKQNQFGNVTSFKSKYPHLKILLSVGGDRDIDVAYPNKYMDLLDGGLEKQIQFIESAYAVVKKYGFDGLDLAYQFPRSMPANILKRKEQFNDFIQYLARLRFRINGLLLTLTMLPRVNPKWYIHAIGIDSNLNFVNLGTYDFFTPTQNPHEADYTAPLYHNSTQNREKFMNVDNQVRYWKSRPFSHRNLNMGFGIYGNAWATTHKSGTTGDPIIQHTNGPARGDLFSRKDGVVSYSEICNILQRGYGNNYYNSSLAASFAYNQTLDAEHEGFWLTYDNLVTLANKARYASRYIGGVAIFDLGFDDFQGYCNEEKFLILNHIRSYLLHPEQPDPKLDLHQLLRPKPQHSLLTTL
ncbi:hypothetical protein KR215_009640 [Drosophila sulfurigaster]|nr:hypothetical protein KR215_009640 [Drosophila sulfurigaster]